MYKFSITIVLILCLFSCRNQQKEISLEQESAAEMEEEEEAEVILHIPSGNFHAFTFRCTENCGNNGATEENMSRYGKHKPFNISTENTDSLLSIEFRFIDDCCLRHKGIINLNDNILLLSYANISKEVCECWCEYQYIFNIRKTREFDSIRLNGTLIEL